MSDNTTKPQVPVQSQENNQEQKTLEELHLNSLPSQFELQKMIEELVSQMESQFENVASQINKKMEDMDTRITELEKGIGNLLDQASTEVDQ